MLGVVHRRHVLAERHQLRLVRHVGHERRHGDTVRRVRLGQQRRLGHVRRRHVAHRHAAALGGELPRQLPSHPVPPPVTTAILPAKESIAAVWSAYGLAVQSEDLARAATLLGGDAAWPAVDGEPVFDEPWQGRAFAMAFEVLDRTGLPWDAFREHLVAAIADEPDRPYYESWLVALERLALDDRRGRRRRDRSRPQPRRLLPLRRGGCRRHRDVPFRRTPSAARRARRALRRARGTDPFGPLIQGGVRAAPRRRPACRCSTVT